RCSETSDSEISTLSLHDALPIYDEEIVYSGPQFEKAELNNGKISISFTHTGSGLTTSDGEPPAEFAIAGEDKKFVWAKTRIEGEDRKSTRLNSSHVKISYAVFCL